MKHNASRLMAPLLAAGALSLSVACAPGSGTPSASGAATALPTAQAVATSVAPTVQAVASMAVPSAQALATQVGPTAQALATQVAPTVQAAQQTATAMSPVVLEGFRLDLADTTLTLRNQSAAAIDLSNHQIRVGTTSVPMPANARIQPSGTLTIHTGSGAGDASNVYLGDEARSLITSLRPGASVALIRDDGQRTVEFTIPGL